MPIRFSLPTVLSRLADGQTSVECQGGTIGEIVEQVARQFPRLASRLRDEAGEPYRFVTFYLNDEDIRFRGGFGAAVKDGDEVTVVAAIAGG